MIRSIAITGFLLIAIVFAIVSGIRSEAFRVADLDLGDVEAESRVEAELRVENRTGKGRAVLGIRPSCPCVIAGHFPVTVAAGEAKNIPFTIATPKAGEAFEVSLLLYIDTPGIGQRTVRVRGVSKR